MPAPKLAVRKPAVAGRFYPADAKALRATVDACLAEAPTAEFKGRLLALIAPHAGYEFSGKVAGCSFKQVRKGAFQRVIVLGTSHYGDFRGFSIMDVGAYATPLGDVPLDRPACAKLAAHELHVRADDSQAREHSIEVELPFLQAALGEFQLVPILVGRLDAGDAEKIAAALREYLTPSTLVVVSSDFTHYGQSYGYVPFTEDIEQNLRKLDMGAVDLILRKDYDGYVKYMRNPAPTICGRFPIEVLLKLLPAEAEGRLLKYDTSGRITGDFTLSVSYVSAVFTVRGGLETGGGRRAGRGKSPDGRGEEDAAADRAQHARGVRPDRASAGDRRRLVRAHAGAQGRMRRVRDAEQKERRSSRLYREHRLRGAAAATRADAALQDRRADDGRGVLRGPALHAGPRRRTEGHRAGNLRALARAAGPRAGGF